MFYGPRYVQELDMSHVLLSRKGPLLTLSLKSTGCPGAYLKCDGELPPYANNCISFTRVCDGYNDCQGGQDENGEICGSK